MKRDWNLKTTCPTCGAKPGRPCLQTTAGGTRAIPHPERQETK